MMTFQMDSVKLRCSAFKSMSDVHKIDLQRLGLPILLFYLILETNDLYLYKDISFKPSSANVPFLDPFLKLLSGKKIEH